jgi:hypothetical protein
MYDRSNEHVHRSLFRGVQSLPMAPHSSICIQFS